MNTHTIANRKSEREFVVTSLIPGPKQRVFDAWAKPEIFKKWWVPKGAPMTLVTCELDVRKGGRYRLEFNVGSQNMEFFGKYLEVVPASRVVWTNDEGGEEASTITTVTFEEIEGSTRITVHDLYASKAALDAAIAEGSTSGMPAQLAQLDELISQQSNR